MLHDFSVDKKKRATRADALTRLGRIFQNAKSPDGAKPDAMGNLEKAMRKAFTKNEDGGESDEEAR